MKRRSAASLWLVCLFVAACTAPRPAVTLQSVELPDLSNVAPSAQRQIREQHAALTTLASDSATAPVDLSRAFGEMGKLLMAAQYGDAAERCFLNAQTLNTADYRWPYYLAQLYRGRGDIQKSLAHFERTRALKPDDVATLVWLGDANLSLGRPDAAEPLFQQALSLQPNSNSARYGLGRAALARNDAARAVTLLEEVLARDSSAAAAHYPLSQAYTALGDSAKAEAHLRLRANHEILPADPLMVDLEGLVESPQTHESQGIRALDRGDWSSAAAEFRKGLALAPESPALHHRLGTSLSMQGDKAGRATRIRGGGAPVAGLFPRAIQSGRVVAGRRPAVTRLPAFQKRFARGQSTPKRDCASPRASGAPAARRRRSPRTSRFWPRTPS